MMELFLYLKKKISAKNLRRVVSRQYLSHDEVHYQFMGRQIPLKSQQRKHVNTRYLPVGWSET